MLKKGLNHFFQLTCFLVNMQFIFAPMALAQTVAPQQTGSQQTLGFLNQVGGFLGNTLNSQQNIQSSVDAFKSQLSPQLTLTPIDPNQVPPVFAGCAVYPASGATLTGGLSCREATIENVAAGYATAIIDIAEQNRQQLQNFLTPGHERFTTQGVGCYDKSIEDFKASLTARDERITAFINDLTNRIENLELPLLNADGSTRNVPVDEYLDLIKTDEALLSGAPTEFIRDVNFDEFLLGNNDRVCNTFLSESQIRQTGARGLRAIEDSVFEQANSTQGGRLTADEALTKANDIRNEITQYGNELANLSSRRDSLELNTADVTYSSRLSGRLSASINRVTSQFNTELGNELRSIEEESNINQAVATAPAGFESADGYSSPTEILAGIRSGATNFRERIRVLDRRSKNSCLKNTVNEAFPGGIASFANSFRDPQVSTKFARETRSAFADTIISQLNSDNDITSILTSITDLENSGRNSRKVANLDQLITTLDGRISEGGTTQVSAVGAVRPSAVIGKFVALCQAQSANNTNEDGFTNDQVIAKLTQYGEQYTALKSQAPQKIKQLLTDEIVNCAEDTTTGTDALSCTDALNPSDGNFCVRTAVSCASNYNGCLAKTKNVVENIVNQQEQKVSFLKETTEDLKESIKTALAGVTSAIAQEALTLDAQLALNDDTNFKLPDGIDFNLNANFDFSGDEARGINSEFNLDDPKAILAHAQEKVELLRRSIAEHSNQVESKLEEVKEGYLANYRNQQTHWQNIISECEGRNNQYTQQLAEQKAATDEQNSNIAQFCAKVQAFNGYNNCDSISDISSDATQIAAILNQQSGGAQIPGLAQAQAACNAQDSSSRGTPSKDKVAAFCEENQHLGACADLQKVGLNRCNNNESVADVLAKKGRVCTNNENKIIGADKCEKDDKSVQWQTWSEKIINENKDTAIALAGCSSTGTTHSKLASVFEAAAEAYNDNQQIGANGLGEQTLTPALCGAVQGNTTVAQKSNFENIGQEIQRAISGATSTIEGGGTPGILGN